MNLANKINSKYCSLSAPVKAALWFTICNILQKGIALLTTPLFTRLLTSEQYGVYSIYQSWYSIISILATMNLSSGVYNNAMTKFPDDRPKITSAFQGLSTTITLFLFFIYILNTDFWNELLGLHSIFMICMFLELIFVPAYSFWTVSERYDYSYRKIILVTAIIAIGSPVLGTVSVLLSTYKAEARVLSYVLVQIAIGIFFYYKNMKSGGAFFNKAYWAFALRFNLPLIPHYLAMTILNQSDRIMIGRIVGSSQAAIYSVAYTVSTMMTLIINAVNSSFVPYTYKAMETKRYKDIRRNTNLLLLVIAALCIATMCFGPEIVAIFATKEYYEAVWIIPPVSASVFFMFLYPLFSNVEFYYEKTNFVMFVSGSGAVLNIILNSIYINKYGYLAAGYTTLICYIIFALSHFCYYKWIVKNNNVCEDVYDAKYIFALSIVVIAVMFFMIMIYKKTVLRYSVLLCVCILGICFKKRIMEAIKYIRKK